MSWAKDASVLNDPAMGAGAKRLVARCMELQAYIETNKGALIDDELQAKPSVNLLGPWLPLGYQNTYSTSKPIRSFGDMAGMKIRNSGGAGQAIRAKFSNAQPNMTAWRMSLSPCRRARLTG